ncbi:hypothetical protein Trydic_g4125 [Trypoxylus dichotomus]
MLSFRITTFGSEFYIQDNNPKHASKLCKDYLQHLKVEGFIKVTEWPLQSPNPNSIKLLWEVLDREKTPYHFVPTDIVYLQDQKKMSDILIVGNIIHCIGVYQVQLIENGYVLVKEGKITEVGSSSDLKVEGLIDTHIHAPQYPNVGLGYDKTLLDWLLTYTYPTEARYSDLDYSRTVYNALVRKTLAYGTTTACYFGSLFRESTLVLTDAITEHGQRAFVGKINMIRLAPDDYIETREESIAETDQFITDVRSRKNALVMPIITPRFALSVDTEFMRQLSVIARERDVHIQSHISENKDEIQSVHEQYHTDYATAYDKGDMLTNKTIMAHAVFLEDSELELLEKRGTSLSHCPASNTLLKSGLCDIRRIQKYNINIGLGTDVSGGASPSIINAMRSAITTSIHVSMRQENYLPLTYEDVFYLATLGGAKALSLADKIGNFQVGKEFDALVVDMKAANSSADYFDNCTPMELLQKFVFLGDDRNVRTVFVDGKQVKPEI